MHCWQRRKTVLPTTKNSIREWGHGWLLVGVDEVGTAMLPRDIFHSRDWLSFQIHKTTANAAIAVQFAVPSENNQRFRVGVFHECLAGARLPALWVRVVV